MKVDQEGPKQKKIGPAPPKRSEGGVEFDDLTITHTKTNLIQYNEYYPFGLQTRSSWTRENATNSQL